jgi:Ca-activated chloride channel family protein
MNWSAWAVEKSDGGAQRDVHLLVTAQAGDDEPRAPLLVNLLLDRSGSMKGAPLSAAVEAALQLIDLARPDDFLGLVLFDGVAEQRVPVTPMDARGKKAMTDALQGVQTGRGTALHQALELGARGLQRILVPGRKSRLLVLTDGEPSVGPDTVDAFEAQGQALAQQQISVHALGLARHYVAEILEALTHPGGNGFEHVDGPEGLSEALGAVFTTLIGHVATEAQLKVQPTGFVSLACRHDFPARLEKEALVATLGDVSRGFPRRVLFSGGVSGDGWGLLVEGTCRERGDLRQQQVTVENVAPDSARGRLTIAISHELELVACETASWLSLARKDLERAELQLSQAETHLRSIVALTPEGLPVRRHLERLGDLRLAVERGEGDIPLLIRRAQSARAGTNVSQVIPLQAYRKR